MCADTTVQEEEEEDPSDGKSDYAFDEDALLSDLSSGKSYTGSFPQLPTPPVVHIIRLTKKSYNLTSTYPTTKEIVPPAYPQ